MARPPFQRVKIVLLVDRESNARSPVFVAGPVGGDSPAVHRLRSALREDPASRLPRLDRIVGLPVREPDIPFPAAFSRTAVVVLLLSPRLRPRARAAPPEGGASFPGRAPAPE